MIYNPPNTKVMMRFLFHVDATLDTLSRDK